jgi:hyperosmotically inducible periplasmic protein
MFGTAIENRITRPRAAMRQQERVSFPRYGGFMKNLLATTLSAVLTFGAITTVYAADTSDTGMAAADQSAQPGTDAWITTKVKTELMATKGIPSTDISVTTTNGVVTLSGVVDNKAEVQKSIAVAKAVKGVNRVDSSALSSRN